MGLWTGVCVFQDVLGQGVCIPACTWAGDVDVDGGVYPPPLTKMATAVDGTHPKGMHYCFTSDNASISVLWNTICFACSLESFYLKFECILK